MTLESAWDKTVTATAGIGVGHAAGDLIYGTSGFGSPLLIVGGIAMLAIALAGIFREYKRGA